MQVRELFATFGIDYQASGGDEADAGMEKINVSAAAVVAGVAAATAAIVIFSNHIVGLASDITNFSVRSGIAADDLQRLAALGGTVGASMESIAKGAENASLAITEAAQGGTAADDFERLGIATHDAEGNLLSGADAFYELARAAQALEGGERVEVLKLMGRAGVQLGALMGEGAEGIREQVEAMGDFTGLSDEARLAANRLEMKQAALGLAFTSVESKLAEVLLPAVEAVTGALTGMAAGFIYLIEKKNLITAFLIVIGAGLAGLVIQFNLVTVAGITAAGSMALAWIAAAAPFIAIAVAIALAVVTIDDLLTYMDGGQSVIGDFIWALSEFTPIANILDTLRMAWDLMVAAFSLGKMVVAKLWSDMVAAIVTAVPGIVGVADTIKAAFGAALDWVGDKIDALMANPIVARVLSAATAARDVVAGAFAEDEHEPTATYRGLGPSPTAQGGAAATSARGGGGGAAPSTVNTTNSVTVNARTNASPEEIGRQVGRVLERNARQTEAALVAEPAGG